MKETNLLKELAEIRERISDHPTRNRLSGIIQQIKNEGIESERTVIESILAEYEKHLKFYEIESIKRSIRAGAFDMAESILEKALIRPD